jgi:tRNA pseudouridine synthase 2
VQAGGVLGGILQEDDLDEAEEDAEPPVSDDVTTQFKQPTDGTVPGPAISSSNRSSTGGSSGGKGIIRPGIVHRLDRGTSGLMVVAKTDAVHAALCQQFKERSVSRIYNSITIGVPMPQAARVATNIVR